MPIVTNPNVEFMCGEETIHMAPGECWIFDTFRRHRVRNGGAEKRVHLVLDTVGGEPFGELIDEARAGAPVPAEPMAARIGRSTRCASRTSTRRR